jgi:hypothetical protein
MVIYSYILYNEEFNYKTLFFSHFFKLLSPPTRCINNNKYKYNKIDTKQKLKEHKSINSN